MNKIEFTGNFFHIHGDPCVSLNMTKKEKQEFIGFLDNPNEEYKIGRYTFLSEFEEDKGGNYYLVFIDSGCTRIILNILEDEHKGLISELKKQLGE